MNRTGSVRLLVLVCVLALAACGGGHVAGDAGGDGPGPDAGDPGPGADGVDPGPQGDVPEEATDPGPVDPGQEVPVADVPDVPVDTFENRMDAWFGPVRPECRPPDLGCRSDPDCEAGAHCVATGCVAPVQPSAYAFGDRFLAVTAMALPGPGATDGFDLTGDGVPDNVVASAIASFPDGVGIANRLLRTYVASGVVSLMLELRDPPADACGPLQVALHTVTRDLDLDGIPDDGPYRVRHDSFRADGYGPIGQLNTAVMDGTLVLSGPGVEFPLKIPLTDGTVMTLPLEGLRIEATLPAAPVALVPGAPAAAPATAVLGGYVRLSRVVEEANRQGRDCACAGVDPEVPMASFSIEGDLAQARCDQAIDDGPCDISADGRFCGNLGAICLGLMVMAAQADVATGSIVGSDGAPVKDALSLAMYLDLAPADLAEPPLAPDFAAVADTWRMSPDCDQLQDDGMTQIGVLANDFVDAAVASPIVGVSAGEAGATIIVGPRGDRIFYTPAAGRYGFDSFLYTIRDVQGNESSARVDVRVGPRLVPGADDDLAAFCRNRCLQASVCDAEAFQSLFAGDRSACESDCSGRFRELFSSVSDCGLAWRRQEICRAALPCFNLGEFDAAMIELEAGGNPAWYQCWDEVHARLDACGDCDLGTKPDPSGGAECLPDDPCHPDPCTGPRMVADSCMPSTGQDGKQDWSCQCAGDAMWDWMGHECFSWCEPNPCLGDPNSTGVCHGMSVDWSCECKEAHYFDVPSRLCLPM